MFRMALRRRPLDANTRARSWHGAWLSLVLMGACSGRQVGDGIGEEGGYPADAPSEVMSTADAGAVDATRGDASLSADAREAGDAGDAGDIGDVADGGGPSDASLLGSQDAQSADATLDATPAADTGPSVAGEGGGDAAVGLCTDTDSYPGNCGACGHDCLGGGCSAGACLPFAVFSEATGFPSSIAIDANRLYWTETEYNKVMTLPLSGGNATLLSAAERPTAIAVNGDAVYWVTQGGALSRLRFTESTPTTLATSAGESTGLALSARSAYWTTIAADGTGNGVGSVLSIPLGGGAVGAISATENVPAGIVVTASSLYWLDLNTQFPLGSTSLVQAPLAGGAPVTLVARASGQPNGLDAIATYGNNVFFTIQGTLYRLPLSGGQSTRLATNVAATALAVDGSGIYATARGEVLFVPLAGGIATPLAQGLFSPRGLVLDDKAIYFTDADVVMKLAKPPASGGQVAGVPNGPPDAALPGIIDKCSGARDVLYVDQIGSSSLGGVPLGVQTYTNLSATWSGSASSLSVGASAATPINVVGGGSVGVTTVPGIPIAPATYPQPINSSVPRPFLNLTLGDVNLTTSGGTSGTFVIQDVAVDDAGTGLNAWVVGFDLTIASSRFLGCMRYAADPVDPASPDGVTVPGTRVLDGVSGAGLLAPCSGGGTELYMERTGGYPGVPGVTRLVSANASFRTGVQGSGLEIDALSNAATWQIVANPVPDGPPAPGAYSTSDEGGPTFALGTMPVPGCSGISTGTYGITQLATAPSNSGQVLQTALWFDLQCNGSGALRGCAVYGQ